MRRPVFIFLIVAVVAVVGFYTFLELRVSEIVFVPPDRVETWAFGKEMALRRLYNSGVDVDAFFAKIEEMLVNAEFTEDEIYAAALASGVAEFYTAFYFSTYGPTIGEDVFEFDARIRQEFAPGQVNFNFRMADLRLEITTDIVEISDFEMRAENPALEIPGTPVISANRRTLAVELDNVSGYSLTLTGTGSVTFQYTYSVVTSGLFTSVALEEQILRVHANISRDENGEFQVEYINDPWSSLDEFFGF
jgi:hypothetical protein